MNSITSSQYKGFEACSISEPPLGPPNLNPRGKSQPGSQITLFVIPSVPEDEIRNQSFSLNQDETRLSPRGRQNTMLDRRNLSSHADTI